MTHTFVLESESVREGEMLRHEQVLSGEYGFGCQGGNRSPQLSWRGAPPGTQSYAVTCYDPDAPTGSGFWHWFVANIPGNVTSLPTGAGDPKLALLPPGAVEVQTDFGRPGYGGPCPPPGGHVHRYIFTVHALEEPQLALPPGCTAAMAGFFVHNATLAKASLIALFRR